MEVQYFFYYFFHFFVYLVQSAQRKKVLLIWENTLVRSKSLLNWLFDTAFFTHFIACTISWIEALYNPFYRLRMVSRYLIAFFWISGIRCWSNVNCGSFRNHVLCLCWIWKIVYFSVDTFIFRSFSPGRADMICTIFWIYSSTLPEHASKK